MALEAGIEVTRACNFRCRHCMVDAGRKTRELDRRAMSRVLADLAGAGCSTIGWSGGEPLLRRDLEELTAVASSLGMASTLATNGFFATRERLHGLKRRGLVAVQVSLDAPDEARAGRHRLGPAGTFRRAVAAVGASRDAGLFSAICTVLDPDSAAESEEMRLFAGRIGAQVLRYTMWGPIGRAAGAPYDERAWGGRAVKDFLLFAARHRAGRRPHVVLDCPTGALPGSRSFSCAAGEAAVYVTALGDVYPCTALMVPRYRAGNVHEEPLAAILASDAMRRAQRDQAKAAGGACRRCDLSASCKGGCPGRTLAAWGRLRGGTHDGEAPACLRRLHDPRHRGPRSLARRG